VDSKEEMGGRCLYQLLTAHPPMPSTTSHYPLSTHGHMGGNKTSKTLKIYCYYPFHMETIILTLT